jgi:hypothetical protein
VAGLVVWRSPVAAPMRLNLTGTAGLKVAGTVVVDGVPREFTGVLPTNIAVEARTFEYTILMQEPRGELAASTACMAVPAAPMTLAEQRRLFPHLARQRRVVHDHQKGRVSYLAD